jgi:hypothetical protein
MGTTYQYDESALRSLALAVLKDAFEVLQDVRTEFHELCHTAYWLESEGAAWLDALDLVHPEKVFQVTNTITAQRSLDRALGELIGVEQ